MGGSSWSALRRSVLYLIIMNLVSFISTQAVEALHPGRLRNCGWTDAQCLAALQTVLGGCEEAAAAAWLPRLGRVVGLWARWAGAADRQPAEQEAVACVLGELCRNFRNPARLHYHRVMRRQSCWSPT